MTGPGVSRTARPTTQTAERVHDDPAAYTAAESIGARAYTDGNHIVFGTGGLPGGGSRLLAHELAHVVQNRSADGPLVPSRLSQPDDPAERAADAVAERIASGGIGGPVGSASRAVSRAATGPLGAETTRRRRRNSTERGA